MFRKFSKSISIADALHGCRAGRIQSVGYMQVIPLLSDLSDDRFVSPIEAEAEVFTTDYGTLGFKNPSEAVMIVPCHAGYVVKEAAQDHAMAHAGVVQQAAEKKYTTAMCIQSSQGGYISRGAYRMLILPLALRERALEIRGENNYSKLWDAITEFNGEFGLTGGGHLEYFLNHFRKELDEFVAEFESVPHQIGAIVLVDDQIVGIERAPSHAYWENVWPSLIRECYGSLAIHVARHKGENAEAPASRTALPEDIDSLDELASVIADIAREEDERAKETVRELIAEELTLSRDETVAGLRVETLEAARFAGQVIRDGERIVYASMTATKKWLADHAWRTAQPFAI